MSFRIFSYKSLNLCERMRIFQQNRMPGLFTILERKNHIIVPKFQQIINMNQFAKTKSESIYEVYEDIYEIRTQYDTLYEYYDIQYNNTLYKDMVYLPSLATKGDMVLLKPYANMIE